MLCSQPQAKFDALVWAAWGNWRSTRNNGCLALNIWWQLSLISLWGRKIEYRPLAGV